MNGKAVLIMHNGVGEFPLCASDIKKDYGNAVDLTNVATYTTTVDGYLVSDSGDKPINKGTVINNPNKTSILFVPKRNSSLLPQETNASQIPCFDGTSNVEAELESKVIKSENGIVLMKSGKVCSLSAESVRGSVLKNFVIPSDCATLDGKTFRANAIAKHSNNKWYADYYIGITNTALDAMRFAHDTTSTVSPSQDDTYTLYGTLHWICK